MSDDIEQMIATMRAALRLKPDYPYHLVGLAEMVATRQHRLRAAELAREAMALARDDAAVTMRGRRLLSTLLPGYHVPMMNDARRNAAWDRALRRAIRPDMLVLEIGTGAGMLALMAARAGATVVTCEVDRVAAAMAREIAVHNGYGDRITVVAEKSQRLEIGTHLDRRADLLVCDIFGDQLLDFEPLAAIADARRRLLVPGAPSVPAAGSLCAALADWSDYERAGHIDTACGFDLTPFVDFVSTTVPRPIGSADIKLLSAGEPMLRFDFANGIFPPSGRRAVPCQIARSGEANAIVRWIRLDLDNEIRLEARPEPGALFFSGLTVTPLGAPLPVVRDQPVTIGAAYDALSISTWIEDTGTG